MSDEIRTENDAEIEIDPVCGATVDIDDAAEHDLGIEYQGREYLFCGPECRARFEHAPDRYAVSGRTEP